MMAKKMKKKLSEKDLHTYLTLLLVGVIVGVSFTKLSAWSDRQHAPARIHAALPSTRIDAIALTPLDGLYQVTAGNNQFYADETGRYLVFGHIYDIQTRTDISTAKTTSPQSRATAQPMRPAWSAAKEILPSMHQNTYDNDGYVNVNTLPAAKDAIQSGIANGVPLAIFLDPDCPYCQALQAELSVQNRDLSIREYLMPIPELHPDAPAHASAIWCSDNPLNAINNYMINGKLPPTKACDASFLARIQGFTRQQGWQATPTLVRADGGVYEGYMPYDQLVAWAKAGLTTQTQGQGGSHA